MSNESIDKLICVLKKIYNDPDSTTFKPVKDYSHPLFKCVVCNGYVFECRDYKSHYELQQRRNRKKLANYKDEEHGSKFHSEPYTTPTHTK